MNDASSGKIGALHEFQNFRQSGGGVVHQRDGGVHDFGEIVRRNLGRHAYGDTVRSIHQQVGNTRGQNVGLNFALVIVGTEVDRIFVEIFQQPGGHLRQFRFGVTVGRGRVSIDRPEVALPEHQRITQAPGLGEAHQRVIHRQVSVGMIFAHYFSDDPGAFAGRLVRSKPHLLHGV